MLSDILCVAVKFIGKCDKSDKVYVMTTNVQLITGYLYQLTQTDSCIVTNTCNNCYNAVIYLTQLWLSCIPVLDIHFFGIQFPISIDKNPIKYAAYSYCC